MAYIALTLVVVSCIIMISLYFGIWGGVLDAFTDERVRNDLLTASRLSEYEQARAPRSEQALSTLSFFKQTEKLSNRQREIFRDILNKTNRSLSLKFSLLLAFIAWGSIYLSHKTAGPLYRFDATLTAIEKGDVRPRINLRAFDEAHFLAKHFNRTLESLDQLFSRLKIIIRENESNPERMTSRLKEELAKIKTSADR